MATASAVMSRRAEVFDIPDLEIDEETDQEIDEMIVELLQIQDKSSLRARYLRQRIASLELRLERQKQTWTDRTQAFLKDMSHGFKRAHHVSPAEERRILCFESGLSYEPLLKFVSRRFKFGQSTM